MAVPEQQKPKANNLYTKRGGSTPFERDDTKSEYKTKSHMYPNDLFASDGRYGGNYAIFYINVNIDSKLGKTLGDEQFVKEFPPRDRGD